METKDGIKLFSLAAIWERSFIIIEVLVTVLGPVATACLRLLICWLALVIYFQTIRFKIDWDNNFKHFFDVGLVNSSSLLLIAIFSVL